MKHSTVRCRDGSAVYSTLIVSRPRSGAAGHYYFSEGVLYNTVLFCYKVPCTNSGATVPVVAYPDFIEAEVKGGQVLVHHTQAGGEGLRTLGTPQEGAAMGRSKKQKR